MKVGLYFGTYNPIHIGHLVIANYMLEFTDLDEIWYVVTPHNPFKKKNTLLDDRQRLYMVNLAIEDVPGMRSTDIEFGLPQPSYTANTLAALVDKYPDKDFALIMGADNLQTFHKWKNYEAILDYHELYVYPRIEADGGKLKEHPKVHMVNAPIMQIASTFIRKAIKDKKNVSPMLPPKVWQYIDEMNFYKK